MCGGRSHSDSSSESVIYLERESPYVNIKPAPRDGSSQTRLQ